MQGKTKFTVQKNNNNHTFRQAKGRESLITVQIQNNVYLCIFTMPQFNNTVYFKFINASAFLIKIYHSIVYLSHCLLRQSSHAYY